VSRGGKKTGDERGTRIGTWTLASNKVRDSRRRRVLYTCGWGGCGDLGETWEGVLEGREQQAI